MRPLSDRDSERDAELALDLGVDDYVGIPIKPFEFAARARRLLIRQKNSSAAMLEKFGDWTFDRNMSQAIHEAADGVQHASTLTDREFRLAIALFRNAGRPISRNHLLEGAGYAPVGKARLLDNLIQYNRENFKSKLKMPVLGVGGEMSFGAGVGASLAAVAERVESIVVAKSGHFVSEEQPDELGRVLLSFFKDQGRSPGH